MESIFKTVAVIWLHSKSTFTCYTISPQKTVCFRKYKKQSTCISASRLRCRIKDFMKNDNFNQTLAQKWLFPNLIGKSHWHLAFWIIICYWRSFAMDSTWCFASRGLFVVWITQSISLMLESTCLLSTGLLHLKILPQVVF